MIIKRIGPVSAAKMAGTLYAIIGLIIGAFMSLFSIVGGLASAKPEGAMFGFLFGAGSIVIMPLFYGCLGFVGTLVSAWLYNVLARMVGGVQIEVE